MGTEMSTRTTSEIEEMLHQPEVPPSSVSGRKQSNEDRILSNANVISEPEDFVLVKSSTDEETESEYESDYETDDDSDEEDEEWNERLQILADAKNLRRLAGFFMHPEKPVVTDATAFARCYFSRFSAPKQTSVEEEREISNILADCKALKKVAVDYLHPERPVEVDATATARNYFTRPSAPTSEEEDYRQQVLADAAALKKVAIDYLHPERPVVTTDPYAMGRNYFSRPSAPEYEDEEYMDDRDEILEDMQQLKKLAQDYLQPERPVEIDPLASCRNYFDRASAVPQETFEEAEERARILAEGAAMKKLAVDYLHPEKPVVTTDPFACGRNYFGRASAEEYEDAEEAAERTQILKDMAALKKLAVDYLHPEKPVEVDAFASGRNYFSRYGAPEYDDIETAMERERITKDMQLLKKLATDYLHPELPVDMGGPTAMGRNYFNRPSAPGHTDQIQTQAVVDGMHEFHMQHHHHVYDHGYYHYHTDDHHSDYHSQSDHFEMDEDVANEFSEFRHSIQTMVPVKGGEVPKEGDEEEEGKLSRSPSSVMLFEEAAK